ncbi:MAG TPA: quinone-dependent dihydroorotate dehydrogenase, partial [bacterium]|nr:quinone-dependent dihydroorotate dehydrogenase [bacterium]
MYKLLRPLLFTLPPEAAHGLAMASLRLARPALPWLAPWLRRDDPSLAVEFCGLRFANPIGLAAGFDKAGRAVDAWQHLGFGHVELGTVTRQPQPGNPKPRAFRYPAERALINRFGFNNPGADAMAGRLRAYKDAGRWPKHPVGLNLGKSKVTPLEQAEEDYLYSLGRLAPYADYIAVNVSSPNTPGLRTLQGPRSIKRLASVLRQAVKRRAAEEAAAHAAGARVKKGLRRASDGLPVLVKLAPDLEGKALLASADAALAGGANGLILTNTTLSREGLAPGTHPEGGLSGMPLQARADAALSAVARPTRGRVPLIGV